MDRKGLSNSLSPFQASDEDTSRGRLKLIPWSAQIINWWQMDGLGNAKESPEQDCQSNAPQRKRSVRRLPYGISELRCREFVIDYQKSLDRKEAHYVLSNVWKR